ncbi:hypothetical protein I4U23_024497 [Adineta vaga]|nr:hypothetical protein I4U23_024497 [Adineta vaga]
MSIIDSHFFIEESKSYHQQQQNTYSSVSSNIHSFSLNDMTEIDLTHISHQNANGSTTDIIINFKYSIFIFQISLGLICACLCLLTITGNLLVLITFRRIRTVGNLFILSLASADLIVDRYWSITSPLQYLSKRTRTRALLLIGFAWGLSLLWVIPIFGWHRLVNNGTRYIDSTKCEPEYTHSKVFKVSTAIINFYLPLLVLMSLNGRIYFEIKRRYKNALLQRYSNKPVNDSPNTCKLHSQRKNSRLPITMMLYDSEKQLCPSTSNLIDTDSVNVSKRLLSKQDNISSLRINYTERKNRPILSPHISNPRRLSTKYSYPFVENNHCTQDELTWFAHHERTRSSISPTPISRRHRAGSKYRLNVDERCFKHSNNCPSCSIYINEHVDTFPRHHCDCYQSYSTSRRATVVCRRCSSIDTMRTSTGQTTATTTTLNIFSLCHCCSSATSAITIHSNIDSYERTRKLSATSVSSTTSRRQRRMSSYSLSRNSVVSNLLPHSNSYLCTRPPNKIKQATVWNQQEKAFRQLFAIVFGFTICFLPYFILYMVVAFCGSCVSERFLTVTIWLGYVNSTINPFLYALSNKHFRRTFNRLLKRDHRRQSSYN